VNAQTTFTNAAAVLIPRTEIGTLAEDIALVQGGWSIDRAVIGRARMIQRLLGWGQSEAAEHLAREIDALQAAHCECRDQPFAADGEWVIGLTEWTDALIRGGILRARHFTSLWAYDEESALTEAIRRYADHGNPHAAPITVSRTAFPRLPTDNPALYRDAEADAERQKAVA
jgi:hypothetical protein